MKINYKSDFELDYTLLDEHGQPMTPPDCPWKLVLSVGNPLKPYVGQCDCINGRNFVASFDGTQYKNCTVADTVIRVFADNHGLPCGQLWATFITYTPNPDFPDGDRRVYTPQATDTFLVAEAGDDPTPAQIQYTANYVVFEHEYTAGQGITIEDDVISATGESYTAGEGITIADGEISVSEGLRGQVADNHSDIVQAQCDIQSQGDRITAVEGSIAGLTVTDPALRQSDATISGEFGKVVKVEKFEVEGETPLGVIGADVVEATFIGNKDNGSFFAFPDSTQEVKTKADDTLLGQGDKTTLEQQINGKASTSSVNAIDGRVTTLENTYEDTMNIANNQLHELIDGKAMIAQALTDRGYPTAPTDSSASMAQKITDMAYDAGWLAQLGYSEQNDGGVKDAVAYSKSIEDGWDAQVTNRNFQNDTKLVFCPRIDTSRYTSMNNFFAGSSLIFMKENDIDMSSVTTAQGMFSATRIAVIPPLYTPLLSGMYLCFNGASVRKIMSLDLSSMPTPSFGSGVVNTEYCVLKNIGKVSNFSWNEANMSNWGNYSEDNRQSLVKTLRDYSFDRVTAGYSACTIKLHANTLARLTNEEIAAITAKGFTLTA